MVPEFEIPAWTACEPVETKERRQVGAAKVAWFTWRSLCGWAAKERPSSGDLDLYPASDGLGSRSMWRRLPGFPGSRQEPYADGSSTVKNKIDLAGTSRLPGTQRHEIPAWSPSPR